MTAGKQELPDTDVKPPSASKSLSVVRKGISFYLLTKEGNSIILFYPFHNFHGNKISDKAQIKKNLGREFFKKTKIGGKI